MEGVQEKAETAGVRLNIGEMPKVTGENGEGESDPERLTRTVAHAIARIGDRVTIFRKLSRQMEGQDKRSGLVSDLVSAVIELYRLNPDAIESLGKQTASNFRARRKARSDTLQPQPGGIQ